VFYGSLARNVLSHNIKIRLYNSLVLPYIDYCCVVWSECSWELGIQSERVQNFGMRFILNEPSRTHSSRLRAERGWLTLENSQNMFKLRLVYRCINNIAPAYLSENIVKNNVYYISTNDYTSRSCYLLYSPNFFDLLQIQ